MNNYIDMRISGSGNIPSGEYSKISVSGVGHFIGRVRCESLTSSGSIKGNDIECKEGFTVSGSSRFSGKIEAKNIKVSGSLNCEGDLIARESFISSGSVECGKGAKCEHLTSSGSLKTSGDIEAEALKIDGTVNCAGLINAESIEINFDRGMSIGSIGGGKIAILPEKALKAAKKLIPFPTLSRGVNVSTSIEGDEITLECVSCPKVTGRTVTIGQGCNIDLVQYSESIKISPNATVGKVAKI